MKHSDFVHLHVHTEYSILDSTCRIKNLVKKASSYEMPALAMTDNSVLFGTVPFSETCRKAGIKPIIGAEAYLAPKSRTDKTPRGIPNESYPMVLLARNNEGYENLIQLMSIAQFEGKYWVPRIDKEVLSQHSKGLLGMGGFLGSEIASFIIQGEEEKALQEIQFFKDIFGDEFFYLELCDHGLSHEKLVNKGLIQLAGKTNTKLVAANNCHYLDQDDSFAHRIAKCIYSGMTLNESSNSLGSAEYYFKSPEEMKKLFQDIPEAISNTLEVAEKCHFELDLSSRHLPEFIPPDGKSKEVYIRELCVEGMKGRVDPDSKEVQDRLNHEINTIHQMGFLSYFLIVWDFIHQAKMKGIPVGPGRGSAAGSLIAYLLGITNIDPLKFDLLFERFLNPARVSMPDIDIDFCYYRRGEVIDYVSEKYGKKAVAQIITFGTLAARVVIRDVGRVMGLPYGKVDQIAKMIPGEPKMTLKKALDMEPELEALLEEDKEVEALFNNALKLEGLPRNTSVHAAGIIIGNGELTDKVPLYQGQNGEVITQFDGPNSESIGLLKMDFLGLKTLTLVYDAFKMARENDSQFPLESPEDIPIDDKKTFQLLTKANTLGVFQLESAGMRDLMKRLGVQNFADIVALVALYRPGPMQMADEFIQRKHGKIQVKYHHPCLKAILNETFGIMLYQEQVMKCAQVMGGYSLAEADNLRRIMGKKKQELMKGERVKFIEGAVKGGIDKGIAEKTFEDMEYFAGYGFNKSHSVAYGWIAYQTAWLKANYPIEFMAALLTTELNFTDKISQYIDEARHMGIEVLPPSAQFPEVTFRVEKGAIRYGLGAIKGVGIGAAEKIVEARQKGPFASVEDFIKRVDSKAVNKKVLESLVRVGVFDSLEENRRYLFEIIEDLVRFGTGTQRDKVMGQESFFDILDSSEGQKASPLKIEETENWAEHDLLKFEKELLGCYLSGHPLAQYSKLLKRFSSRPTSEIPSFLDGDSIRIGGVLSNIKFTRTQKKDEKMAIVQIEDLNGTAEAVVFPRTFEESQDLLEIDKPVFILGTVRFKNDTPSIIVNEILPLESIQEHRTTGIIVQVFENNCDQKVLKLKEIIEANPGPCQVALDVKMVSGESYILKLGQDFSFCPTEEAIQQIEDILGEDSVWLHIKDKVKQSFGNKKKTAKK